MNNDLYSAVTLDGKELHNLTIDEIKDLFLARQVNQNSLVFSLETQNWQMLKRLFDISQWIPAQNVEDSQYQTVPANEPEFADSNFEISDESANSFPPDSANEYSQSNQSRQFNQATGAPNKARFAGNSQTASIAERAGARQAAVFICVNAVFFVISMLVGSLIDPLAGANESEKIGFGVGRSILPLIIDLWLASKLWKSENIDSTRKWVLFRAYFGFLIFGLVLPFIGFNSGDYVVSVLSFVSAFFYLVSLAVVLHGKQNPSSSRVMIGVGTFAVYSLFLLGMTGLTAIAVVSPGSADFASTVANFDEYKIEGSEFQDVKTGAKVNLPEGWKMLELDNPLVHTPEARMIAVDDSAKSLTMLEVVPVPADVDLKTINSLQLLDSLSDYVAKHIAEQSGKKGAVLKDSGFREITRLNIYTGKHPAKLLVFEKFVNRQKVKGHLVITFDKLSLYVLHSWCPAADYDRVQNDFAFFEKSFVVPERANAPLSQSAEVEKLKTASPKNF